MGHDCDRSRWGGARGVIVWGARPGTAGYCTSAASSLVPSSKAKPASRTEQRTPYGFLQICRRPVPCSRAALIPIRPAWRSSRPSSAPRLTKSRTLHTAFIVSSSLAPAAAPPPAWRSSRSSPNYINISCCALSLASRPRSFPSGPPGEAQDLPRGRPPLRGLPAGAARAPAQEAAGPGAGLARAAGGREVEDGGGAVDVYY